MASVHCGGKNRALIFSLVEECEPPSFLLSLIIDTKDSLHGSELLISVNLDFQLINMGLVIARDYTEWLDTAE